MQKLPFIPLRDLGAQSAHEHVNGAVAHQVRVCSPSRLGKHAPLRNDDALADIARSHRQEHFLSAGDVGEIGLFRRLVTLPVTIVTATTDILTNAGDALKLTKDRRTFNSIAGMSPGNPAIEALRAIPVASGIHAHSIIPTLQDGPLETRDDGVVAYKSAHIDGVDSELVIEHQGHSVQSNPLAVREVRRILIEQLARPSL